MKEVKLTLDTAKELYKAGGASKSFTLDNYSEEKLTGVDYTIEGDQSNYGAAIEGDQSNIDAVIKGHQKNSFAAIEGDQTNYRATIKGDQSNYGATIKGDQSNCGATIEGRFNDEFMHIVLKSINESRK